MRKVVMFVVANDLESIILREWTIQALGPAAHDAFVIFENLCLLLGYGKRTQFLQLENLHKPSTIQLIESVHTNYHQPFRKVCLSSSLPTRDLYANSCPQITVMFPAF